MRVHRSELDITTVPWSFSHCPRIPLHHFQSLDVRRDAPFFFLRYFKVEIEIVASSYRIYYLVLGVAKNLPK
jgi:hypothetical protein